VSGEPALAERPRLNPFAFPSDTAFRFGLLVTAVLGATLYVWNWLYFAVGVDSRAEVQGSLACLRLSPASVGATDAASFAAASNAMSACLADLNRPKVWWMLGGAALVLVSALALTAAAPWWIERRRRLEPLTAGDAPAVLARLEELALEAGLRRIPRFVWNPLDASPTGLAFGRFGRYRVALTGGLVTRHVLDPPAFDAVVRHELAHIRNRDVDLTYFAVAVWYAFLAAAVAPFLLTLLDEQPGAVSGLAWRLIALAVLVYGTRNAVLRSRELYADVRASTHDGRDGALRRVLGELPRHGTGLLARARRLHPEPEQRVAAVEDTRPLFRLGAGVAFVAGVTATIAYENVVTLVSFLLRDPLDMRFVAALAFAPLAVGVVGLGIWRHVFAAAGGELAPVRTLRVGLALAAGFLVGPELSLSRTANDDAPLLGSLFRGDDVLWAAALVAGLVLVVAWMAASAGYWLRTLGPRRPVAATLAGLGAGSVVLTAFMGVFYVTRDLRETLALSRRGTAAMHAQVADAVAAGPAWMWQLLMDGQLLVVLQRPLIVPALALLWLFPLAAALVRRREGDGGWAFIDAGGTLRTMPLRLRIVRPLVIGAAAGAVFFLLQLAARGSFHANVAPATRATDEFILSFFVWMLLLAVLAQGGAAIAATAVSRNPSPVLDGMAAAFVAGALCAVGIAAGPAVGGCVESLSLNPGPCAWTVPAWYTRDVLQQVVGQGAAVGLACALAVAGVRALVRARGAADRLAPARLQG
jgi:Zn-dependent protease with chaperone function